jgi:hypothetical protein
MKKPSDSEFHDPLWPVMKPRNGDAEAVQEMNAKMVLFHPVLTQTRKDDHKLMHVSHKIVQRDVSITELFRRIISQP